MSPRTRPEGCCRPSAVAPLPAQQQQRLVATFKALSDPTRLELFRLVSAQPQAVCVCDLVDHFDLSQPTISHHLKVLREAGLLRMKKTGIWAFYEPGENATQRLQEASSLAV